jgi:hypothetical protein
MAWSFVCIYIRPLRVFVLFMAESASSFSFIFFAEPVAVQTQQHNCRDNFMDYSIQNSD